MDNTKNRNIIKFKKLKDKTTIKKFAEEIYSKYLDGSNSPMEVNVNSSTRNEVKKLIDEDNINEDLFSKIQITVDMNLFDTFNRFRFQKSYISYIRALKLTDGMLEIRKSSIPI